MRIYKQAYTGKAGKKKKCQHWYIGFTDNHGTRRSLPAFRNKRATEKAAEKIEELLSSGGVLSPDLQRWMENMPDKMRNRLIKFGLIDSQRVNSNIGKLLTDHVSDFHDSLTAKGNGKTYAHQVKAAILTTFSGCSFTHSSDIDANRLYTFLEDQREINGTGERTFNSTLKSTKQFCRWMIKERRATAPSPLEHLSCKKQIEKRHKRRAISIADQIKLLQATKAGETHHNMAGY